MGLNQSFYIFTHVGLYSIFYAGIISWVRSKKSVHPKMGSFVHAVLSVLYMTSVIQRLPASYSHEEGHERAIGAWAHSMGYYVADSLLDKRIKKVWFHHLCTILIYMFNAVSGYYLIFGAYTQLWFSLGNLFLHGQNFNLVNAPRFCLLCYVLSRVGWFFRSYIPLVLDGWSQTTNSTTKFSFAWGFNVITMCLILGTNVPIARRFQKKFM